MRFELTEDNFLIYAIKNYDNPSCKGIDEFNDDLKRFKYLKRLFKKYNNGKDLKERLILNHIIILNNLFGTDAATKMLFFKIEEQFWPQLKTFLVFLSYMPEVLTGVGEDPIISTNIPLDQGIITALRKI